MRRIRGPLWGDGRDTLCAVPSKELLKTRLRSCYDKSRNTPIDLGEAEYDGCVYVLECGNTTTDRAEWVSLIKHGKVKTPWWIAPAESSSRRLYVGRAKDLVDRLWEHIRGSDHGGAHFTTIFEPHRLRRVFLYDRYDHRDLLEGRVSQTVDRENENCFVYSDRYDSLRGYKDYGDEGSQQKAV